jgi:hypothetical protein
MAKIPVGKNVRAAIKARKGRGPRPKCNKDFVIIEAANVPGNIKIHHVKGVVVDAVQAHVDYLRETLMPDLVEGGREFMAEDFAKLVDFLVDSGLVK